jgi:hypothetical protein
LKSTVVGVVITPNRRIDFSDRWAAPEACGVRAWAAWMAFANLLAGAFPHRDSTAGHHPFLLDDELLKVPA